MCVKQPSEGRSKVLCLVVYNLAARFMVSEVRFVEQNAR